MPPIIINPHMIMASEKKENTSPQQYIGVTRNGIIKHYYHNTIEGKGIILHREDGPAVIWEDNYQEWYFNGTNMECKSQEEFEKKIKLLVFL